ncbi:uncharacterized protein [Littorina saxatilis]|uniref:Uncharacterized protein n=1 Tax=Littorina saxatilis TaxID=31220 RepID=A0AAN9BFH2_9CAEN
MANIGSLPTLNNRRLSVLQKQLNHARKNITITNDKLKESLSRLEKSVNKTKQSDSFRSWQKTIPVKKSMLEMNALKKCLRNCRESSTLDPEMTPRNGIYDGASLDSMRPKVDQIISEKAPTQRRLRKVEKMKSIGYRDGKLVDYHDTLDKFNGVLNRPKVKYARTPFQLHPKKTVLRREAPLGDGYSCSGDSSSSDDFTLESEDIFVEKPRSASVGTVRTLHLPPLRAVKGAARRQSQYERSLPEKKRNTELTPLARRVSSCGPY